MDTGLSRVQEDFVDAWSPQRVLDHCQAQRRLALLLQTCARTRRIDAQLVLTIPRAVRGLAGRRHQLENDPRGLTPGNRARGGRPGRLVVTDNGVGTDIRRIDRRNEGHLGLRLVIDRVHSSRGRFTLTSGPGKGTRVEADLPVDPADGLTPCCRPGVALGPGRSAHADDGSNADRWTVTVHSTEDGPVTRQARSTGKGRQSCRVIRRVAQAWVIETTRTPPGAR